jgi:hypothetical protein
MSANRIFLVCQHCKDPSQALLLAERADASAQYTAATMKRADDWYAKHQRCGPDVDHYQLALQRTANWDLSPQAQDTVAGGVRLALVNGSGSKQ